MDAFRQIDFVRQILKKANMINREGIRPDVLVIIDLVSGSSDHST